MDFSKYKNSLIGILVILAALGAFFIIRAFTTGSNPGYTFTMSSETVVKEMKSLNRLETASFTIEKVIDAGTAGSSIQQFFYGDKILFIAHGQVIAGFNLSEITNDDVKVNGSSLTLTLPAPRILITSLDNDQSRVYDRKLGLLTKGDPNLETKARSEAEKAITQAACEGKILDEAAKNARSQLTTLFKAFKFTSVQINIPQGSCK